MAISTLGATVASATAGSTAAAAVAAAAAVQDPELAARADVIMLVICSVMAAIFAAFGLTMIIAPRFLAKYGIPRSRRSDGGPASVGYSRASGVVLCCVAVLTLLMGLFGSDWGLF